MKKFLFISIGVTLLLIGIMVCVTRSSYKKKVITSSSWDKMTYYNDYFQLKFTLPKNWKQEDQELAAHIQGLIEKDKNIHYLTCAKRKSKEFVVLVYQLPKISGYFNKTDDTMSIKEALEKERLKIFPQYDDKNYFKIESEIINKEGVQFVPVRFRLHQGEEAISGRILLVRKREYILIFYLKGIDESEDITQHPIITDLSLK